MVSLTFEKFKIGSNLLFGRKHLACMQVWTLTSGY